MKLKQEEGMGNAERTGPGPKVCKPMSRCIAILAEDTGPAGSGGRQKVTTVRDAWRNWAGARSGQDQG